MVRDAPPCGDVHGPERPRRRDRPPRASPVRGRSSGAAPRRTTARRALALVALVAAPLALEASGSRTGLLLGRGGNPRRGDRARAGAFGLSEGARRGGRGPPRRRRRARSRPAARRGHRGGRPPAAPRRGPVVVELRRPREPSHALLADGPRDDVGRAPLGNRPRRVPVRVPGGLRAPPRQDLRDGRRDECAPRGGRRMRVARARPRALRGRSRSFLARGTPPSRKRRSIWRRAGPAPRFSRFLVACQTGSHLRFTEIGLLTSLVAAFLFVPRAQAREPPPGGAGSPRSARPGHPRGSGNRGGLRRGPPDRASLGARSGSGAGSAFTPPAARRARSAGAVRAPAGRSGRARRPCRSASRTRARTELR